MSPVRFVQDSEGIQFLQWCLPRLGLRWPGFRKVRKRVYKRVARRIQELGLPGLSAYRAYLDTRADEWAVLDGFCRIPISRFYRDRGVFQYLEEEVLPELGALAAHRGETELDCWSIGCAAGEEPYTLAVVWRLGPGLRLPDLQVRILATDIDPENLARARRGCYARSSLKDLPPAYLELAFVPTGQEWCVGQVYRDGVTFVEQDVRQAAPPGPFDLIFCRNVAFTYFDEARQRTALRTIVERLAAGGALGIGCGEELPDLVPGLEVLSARSCIYRRR
jgi:chemotaxis protein methyltransferase CheR